MVGKADKESRRTASGYRHGRPRRRYIPRRQLWKDDKTTGGLRINDSGKERDQAYDLIRLGILNLLKTDSELYRLNYLRLRKEESEFSEAEAKNPRATATAPTSSIT